MDNNNLFNPSQHGFHAGRSCLNQQIAHLDRILSLIEEGANVDVIYLDFAKAFDKVDHSVLLHKLKCFGIQGSVGRWIYSFLTNRNQSLIVDGHKSDPCPVISGVPQGSVLGPILFLILISDIDADTTSSFSSSFADDTSIGKGIRNVSDASKLKGDLYTIYGCAEANNMQFNNDKFEFIRYGNNAILKYCTIYCTSNGEIIQQ